VKTHKIVALPGDGIGKEIMPLALDVMTTLQEATGSFKLDVDQYPWGCEHYLETGVVMPPDGISILSHWAICPQFQSGNLVPVRATPDGLGLIWRVITKAGARGSPTSGGVSDLTAAQRAEHECARRESERVWSAIGQTVGDERVVDDAEFERLAEVAAERWPVVREAIDRRRALGKPIRAGQVILPKVLEVYEELQRQEVTA